MITKKYRGWIIFALLMVLFGLHNRPALRAQFSCTLEPTPTPGGNPTPTPMPTPTAPNCYDDAYTAMDEYYDPQSCGYELPYRRDYYYIVDTYCGTTLVHSSRTLIGSYCYGQ